MNIPKEFLDVLDKNMNLSGIVRSTVSRFDLIMQESKFEFFPEYTKHDSTHIKTVLENAIDLIGESMHLLNAKDIAVLILSILIHDLGMHITFEGFRSLLEKGKPTGIKEFDNLSWEKEWGKYLQESKKWSGKKRHEVFGKKNLVIKEPSKNRNEHTEIDKMLIGEFIRRHHPRMAHEIALFGFPLGNGDYLPFAYDLEFEIRDLVGLIGRSHGMNLRSTFSYLLEKHQDCRTPYNIKVIYLMVVLRISDFLHITPDRAPSKSLQNLSLSSPVSQSEWKLHQSIKDKNQNHEDPETLFVNARPSNSEEFLKIQSLLKNIQTELDLSWAVIGEIYGRFKELSQLKISIRRVRSNLDNKSYTDSLQYLPEKVMFDSDPEVIKLLVSPLYGGKPSYGVRELIQNAVDACRERKYLNNERSEIEEYKPGIKVAVYEMDSDYYFQIDDNGIGMSADVIVHYFFRAGASYRNSNDWKMNFTVDGVTQIARSGRFGVGVLAAFLLGDQIEVTTKNIHSNRGYSFTASLNDVQIEVNNTIDRSVGTTIRIRLNETALLELKNQVESDYRSYRSEPAWYEWYVLNEPFIDYKFPDDWRKDGFNKFHTVVDINDWRLMDTLGYGFALWKFGGFPRTHNLESSLICNGIVIPDGFRIYSFNNSYPSMNQMPTVAVFDNEGSMPLTLTRDKLGGNGDLPFEKELFQSLILDMLAKLINLEINQTKDNISTTYFRHPILRSVKSEFEDGLIVRELKGEGTLVLSELGYCLPYTRNIKKLGTNKMVQIWPKTSQELSSDIWLYLEYAMISDYSLSRSIRSVKDELYETSFIHDFRIVSRRIYLPKKLGLDMINGDIKIRQDILEKLKIEKELESMVCITMNNPPPATFDDSFFESENGLKVDTLMEIFIAPKKFRKHSWHKEKIEALQKFVDKVLDECFADGVFIPYELQERKERCPRAFEFLSEYV